MSNVSVSQADIDRAWAADRIVSMSYSYEPISIRYIYMPTLINGEEGVK